MCYNTSIGNTTEFRKMAKAQIIWIEAKQKYQLTYKGKSLVTSKKLGYLQYLVTAQRHSAIVQNKITDVEIVSQEPQSQSTFSAPFAEPQAIPEYDVNQRFDFTKQLAKLVIQKKARSLIVGGEGGIGKTHTITEAFKELGKVNVADLMPTIEDLNVIVPEDSEEVVEQKALAKMNAFKGDYVVVKGRVSAKALYRLMWENRNRTIVFDDCDQVLQDQTAVMLMKPALDTYEDCWVSWRIEGLQKDMDLPTTFKFNGSIIFITNMPMHKIDEAVRTRCYKVDVTMSYKQRIERMRGVLHNVMPEVDMDCKVDALNLIEQNLDKCKSVDFRTLMNTITIRTTVDDWEPLAKFALTEH